MKTIRTTRNGKGQIIKTGNYEYSSLGWNHYHRILKGRNAHEWHADPKDMYKTCPKCAKTCKEDKK